MSEETAEKEATETVTDEQLQERREELLKFYTEEIPLLQARFEYEELITKIEEARFARFQMDVAKANMMPPEPEIPETEEAPTKRQLKTD